MARWKLLIAAFTLVPVATSANTIGTTNRPTSTLPASTLPARPQAVATVGTASHAAAPTVQAEPHVSVAEVHLAPTDAATNPGMGKPAMWVVRDADTTIYLLGTVHILPAQTRWFNPTIRSALTRADEMLTEIPDREMRAPSSTDLLIQRALARDGVALSQRLSAEQRALYRQALARLRLPNAMFERAEPWVPGFFMGFPTRGASRAHGVETVLVAAATEQRKRQFGLESVDLQLSYLDRLSEPAQIQLLMGASQSVLHREERFSDLVNAWAKGDVAAIAAVADEDRDNFREFHDALLTNRNRNWAQWISMRIEEEGGTYFIAVGAAHLAGQDSVQHFLRENHRLTAERINY